MQPAVVLSCLPSLHGTTEAGRLLPSWETRSAAFCRQATASRWQTIPDVPRRRTCSTISTLNSLTARPWSSPHRQREAADSAAASLARPECQHDVRRGLDWGSVVAYAGAPVS